MFSDSEIKNMEYSGKNVRKYDTFGLFIDIQKNRKTFRQKIRKKGIDKTITLGHFPVMSVSDARILAYENYADCKALPSKFLLKLFINVAEDWLENVHKSSVSFDHYQKNSRRCELHVFDQIGSMAVYQIKPGHLTEVIQRLVELGLLATAIRVLALLESIFNYAISLDLIQQNPATSLKAQIPRTKQKHHKAIIDATKSRELFKQISTISGSEVARLALVTLAITLARPGDVLKMTWDSIDVKNQTWTFSPSKTSDTQQVNHIPDVLLTQLLNIRRAGNPWVFPNKGGGNHISDCMVRTALNNTSLGLSHSLHGFRAMGRTLLDEELNFRVDVIEAQLSHSVRDTNGRAYNRTRFIKQRREMVEMWSRWLWQ